MGFLDDESKKERLEALKKEAEAGEGIAKDHSELVRRLIGAICSNGTTNAVTFVLSQLEMTEQFR